MQKEGHRTGEREIVAELAARLQRAVEAIHEAEGRLATMGAAGKPVAGGEWRKAIERMRSVDSEFSLIRRIVNISWLRTVGRSPLAS